MLSEATSGDDRGAQHVDDLAAQRPVGAQPIQPEQPQRADPHHAVGDGELNRAERLDRPAAAEDFEAEVGEHQEEHERAQAIGEYRASILSGAM